MTEQQIDAELSRYAPFAYVDSSGDIFVWFREGAAQTEPHDYSDVPAAVYAHLSARDSVSSSDTRYYPTREAAFADLRRAIALTGTNAGSHFH